MTKPTEAQKAFVGHHPDHKPRRLVGPEPKVMGRRLDMGAQGRAREAKQAQVNARWAEMKAEREAREAARETARRAAA